MTDAIYVIKKRRPIWAILLFVLAGIWFLASILSWNDLMEFTQANTTEFTATISNVTHSPFFLISIEEYDVQLLPMRFGALLDEEALNDLEEGQTIVFRIENQDAQFMRNNNWINIVALYAGVDLMTLESLNEYLYNAQRRSSRALIWAGIITFGIATLTLMSYRKQNEQLRLKKQEQENQGSIETITVLDA